MFIAQILIEINEIRITNVFVFCVLNCSYNGGLSQVKEMVKEKMYFESGIIDNSKECQGN